MLPYDPKSSDSIIKYSKKLVNKSLRQGCDENTVFKPVAGKGSFGVLLEYYYFNYKPNSDAHADFPNAEPGGGLELKSTGLLEYKGDNNGYRIDQRLSLRHINFHKDWEDTFLQSPLYKKVKNLLFVFYIRDSSLLDEDCHIKLVDTWSIPAEDLQIIVQDFNIITEKIKSGLAHDLTSGETNYLEASTTGMGHGETTTQPFSEILARPRRFAFKPSYMNYVLSKILIDRYGREEQLLFKKCIRDYANLRPIKKGKNDANLSLDQLIQKRLKKYYGYSGFEIAKKLNINYNNDSPDKAYYFRIIKKILSGEEQEISELVKADITLKAVRIEENNNPQQSISSPAFRFIEDIFDVEWEESEWNKIIQRKYLFVFFKINKEKNYILEKFSIWNMPQADIDECRKIWLKTKELISSGRIFNSFMYGKNGVLRLTKKGNPYKKNNLPKKSESRVCHVRPHGPDASIVFPLPVKDKQLGVMEYSKQCFWLNESYIGDIYRAVK
jgi:DNA mismatch repair protein MutH